MSQKFKTGDVVRLKSGGPDMTVKEMGNQTFNLGQYVCQWFGGKKLEQGHFMPDSLELAKADDK